MEDLLEFLESDIENLNLELSKKDYKLDFFNDFIATIPCNDFIKLAGIDKDKLLLARLLLIDEPLEFDSLKNLSHIYKKMLDKSEGFSFLKLKNIAKEYSNLEKEEIMQIHDLVEKKICPGEVSLNAKNIYDKIVENNKSLFINQFDFLILLDLSVFDFDNSIGAIDEIYNLREVCTILKNEQIGISLLLGGKQKFNLHELKKYLNDMNQNSSLQLIYNVENFINKLVNDVREYQKNANKKKRELLNQKKRDIKLQTEINKSLNSNEITNSKEILELINDPILKEKTAKYIYLHNNKYYQDLDNEYKKLSQNTSLNYQILLSKYGISMDSYDVGSIMNNNIDVTKDMLEKLNKIGITDASILLKILQNSTNEIVNYIYNLCINNTMSYEFFQNNSHIFNKNNNKILLLNNNLKYLQAEKISTHLFSGSEEILLINTSKLKENINILNKYNLFNNIKSGMDLSFIGYKDLDNVIDLYLELGYQDILNKNIDLLNYKDKIDRLYLLKQMNIPVSNYSDIVKILTTDKFMVSDKTISNYLYNAVLFNKLDVLNNSEPRKKILELTKLDKFCNTKLTYDFNGVIISKNKVERNLRNLSCINLPEDRLFSSIIKNSILSDEDILNIKKCIYHVKQKI